MVSNPEAADAVVFSQCHMLPSEWRLEPIRDHPLCVKFRERVMVYDERDVPWCAFPGLYVSMRRSRFNWRAQRPCAYHRVPTAPLASRDPDLLYSFVGSPGPVCRRSIFRLVDSDAVIEEVENFTFYDAASPAFEQRRAHYRDVVARSRFVLCPRGRGTSTFRLYETLANGRVPVIISDDWVPPGGPDWDSFTIRCRERSIKDLPQLIRERSDEWGMMSTAATHAYEEFFSPSASFHRHAELWEELSTDERLKTFPRLGIRDRAFLDAAVARLTARSRLSHPRERARKLLRQWRRRPRKDRIGAVQLFSLSRRPWMTNLLASGG